MNFQAVENLTYWWPVTVHIPSPEKEEAGKLIAQTFKMQFKVVDPEIAIKAQEERSAMTTERAIIDHAISEMVDQCTDWDDVDQNGEAMPFSRDALKSALGQSWMRLGVYRAIAESKSGEEARLGN